jgi:hypothetical protein
VISDGAGRAAGSFEDEAFAATAAAYARGDEIWERSVQVAIAGLFAFLAKHADRTKACIVGEHGAGIAAQGARDRAVARFVALLDQGFERPDAPPPVVAEAIGGGVYEIVRGHVLERRLADLPAAVPEATIVALSPFVGPERAFELARTENVHASR